MPLKLDANSITFADGTVMSTNEEKRIGVGQTWQDVTSSRALAATYTNDTGRPISVSVYGSSSSTSIAAWTGTVDGLALASARVNSGGSGSATSHAATISFIVPPGSSYSISGGGAITAWLELRG